MKGNLKDFSPTQLLRLISLARKTGRLDVKQRGGDAALYFKDGKLVYASMGKADGSLASVLGRSGRISQDQASKLSEHARHTSDKQLGLMLIQKGYISQADIILSIKRHALAAINQFAAWKDGGFSFEPQDQPDDGRITVPIDLENVIIQIARIQKRDEQLEDEIPSLDIPLKYTSGPKERLSDLQLTKDEWRVLHYIKPENTLRMIAKKLDMNDRQMRRVVGSLREAGLVELAHAQRRERMTRTERRERITLVQRLIGRIQGIGASE